MASKLVLFAFSYAVWCVLSWPPDTQHALVGVVVAGVVAWLTGDLFVERVHLLYHPQRHFWFLFVYVPVFLWACLRANIDVAYRVMHPGLPIRPGIVKVRTELRSNLALTMLANSVTLTPGTMSVDVDKDRGTLYVHWIDVSAMDIEGATRRIVGRFERILRRVFE